MFKKPDRSLLIGVLLFWIDAACFDERGAIDAQQRECWRERPRRSDRPGARFTASDDLDDVDGPSDLHKPSSSAARGGDVTDAMAYRTTEQRLWVSTGLVPRESWVDVPTLRARVRIQEVGEGAPVLFLHPVLNAGACWVRLLPFLPGFRCIVIDRPGCGLSPQIEMRSELRPFVIDLLRGILDALELDKVHLVASSFGSFGALALARACRERVGRIVHLSCPALVPGMSVPAPLRLWGVPIVNRCLLRLLSMRPELFLRGMAQAVDRLPKEVTDWWLSLVRDTDTLRNDVVCNERMLGLGGVKRGVQLTTDDLRQIAAPNLFLWGDQDPMGSPDVGQRLVSMMPSARLEIFPNAAHFVWFDAPELAGERTRAFLAESAA